MVKNPPCNAGDMDLIPGLGTKGTKIPQASDQHTTEGATTRETWV